MEREKLNEMKENIFELKEADTELKIKIGFELHIANYIIEILY